MNFPFKSLISLFLTFTFSCFTTEGIASPTGNDSPEGTKRALLIGINKYKAVPKLQGSLNDIETMRQILMTRWGFPEELITVVTDGQATRAGMLAALTQFVQATEPNDSVYVHYSGHGSQVEDLNGDEPDDHLDETLVPQDGRSGDVRDITDDELDEIFSRMKAKRALIVLDSCHSGTATRSLDIRTRSIARDTRIDLYKKAYAAAPKTRAIVPVVTSRYVLMTGAASHQEALDGPVDGRYHGFFTYSLSKSLSLSPLDASPREIFSGVERELKRIQTHFGRSSMPEPQLEAPPRLIDTALLVPQRKAHATSAHENRPRLPWLDIVAGEDGLITLVNGPLLGASLGSTWSIYPPGEVRFTPGSALAIATVTHITGKDSVGKVHSSGGKLSSGSRAIALLPAPTGNRIPIRLLDVSPDRRAEIEATLKLNIEDVDFVGLEEPARFSVDVRGDALRLLSADGLQVLGSFRINEAWGTGVASIVTRSTNATEILTLDNPSSQLKVEVRVATETRPAQTTSTRGIAVVAATKPAKYRIRKQGMPRTESNSLQLEVRVNADSYVTVVDVDSEGGVNVLFPNNYQNKNYHGDGFIRASETMLIPDSIKPGNKAGFYWDYTPPTGTDTVRVFASADLQTANLIREHIHSVQASVTQTGDGLKTRSITGVVQSLRQLLAGIASRGIITVADDTSHIPGTVSTATPEEPMPSEQELLPQDLTTTIPQTEGGDPAVFASNVPQGDWAATSITITISE